MRGTAGLYKCSASISYPQTTYPPTINNAQLVSMVGQVAEGIVGYENWQIAEQPSMAAEDFAWLGSESFSSCPLRGPSAGSLHVLTEEFYILACIINDGQTLYCVLYCKCRLP